MMHGIGSLSWTINQLNTYNTQQGYPPIIRDFVDDTSGGGFSGYEDF